MSNRGNCRALVLLAVSLAAVIGLLAGCGGDGDSSAANGEGTGPTNRAATIKAIDQICRQSQARVAVGLSNFAGASRDEVSEPLVDELIVPEIEAQVEAIEDLDASGKGAEAANEMTTIFEQMIEKAESDAAKFVESGDPAALKRARKYGFKACGSLLS